MEQNGKARWDTPWEFEDLEPQVWRFPYKGKKYFLREATAAAGAKFRDTLARAARFENGKPSGMGEGAGEGPLVLLAGCLFEEYELNGEVKERPVQMRDIRAWPDRVIQDLFERAAAMSGLDKEAETVEDLKAEALKIQGKLDKLAKAEEAEKNSSPATTSTSE